MVSRRRFMQIRKMLSGLFESRDAGNKLKITINLTTRQLTISNVQTGSTLVTLSSAETAPSKIREDLVNQYTAIIPAKYIAIINKVPRIPYMTNTLYVAPPEPVTLTIEPGYPVTLTDLVLSVAPASGTASVNEDGSIITYTPDEADFDGTDTFTYHSDLENVDLVVTVDYTDPENPTANVDAIS